MSTAGLQRYSRALQHVAQLGRHRRLLGLGVEDHELVRRQPAEDTAVRGPWPLERP